jgi:dTDP-4-dehydrorhamnose reductase
MPTLLVTGLAGFLGSEIAAGAPAAGWRVAGTVHQRPGPPEAHRVDIRDEGAVRAAIDAERPDAVVHTAYSRDDEGVTVDGARIVAEAAADAGARLIHISSDLVFGGSRGRPLTEEDEPDPLPGYGAWKARAEHLVRGAHPEVLIIRTSLIYGEHRFSDHERAALDAAMTFFVDELRNPVEVGDLAGAILELAESESKGPLHLAGADAMNRLELARLFAGRRGRDLDVLRGGPGGPDRPKDCRLVSLKRAPLRGAREVLRP